MKDLSGREFECDTRYFEDGLSVGSFIEGRCESEERSGRRIYLCDWKCEFTEGCIIRYYGVEEIPTERTPFRLGFVCAGEEEESCSFVDADESIMNGGAG